jgi:hypothetical protein
LTVRSVMRRKQDKNRLFAGKRHFIGQLRMHVLPICDSNSVESSERHFLRPRLTSTLKTASGVTPSSAILVLDHCTL